MLETACLVGRHKGGPVISETGLQLSRQTPGFLIIIEPMTEKRVLTRCYLLAALLLGLGMAQHNAYADIYMYIDDQGIRHYADYRQTRMFKLVAKEVSCGDLVVKCGTRHKKHRRLGDKYLLTKRRQYAPLVDDMARQHQLKPGLVHAVITVESAYDPKAVSHAGAMGLMQLMPETAKRYGVSDPHDPKQNISGGVRYLSDLLQQFGNLRLALAAYNAGEGAVQRYGNRVPPFKETRSYVSSVLRYYRQYP